MILKKIYDEKTKTQKVWYDSSMIKYSEMVEYENENKGDLFVTFNNGITYKYTGVAFEDYILFIGGGTDASQGKTLNKVIKGKYEYEKVGAADMDRINEEFNHSNEEENYVEDTYFISGHRDITQDEFTINYAPVLEYLSCRGNIKFVIGDYYGADIMAQNYLLDVLNLNPDRITVYHMGDSARNLNPKVKHVVGGFESDDARDEAMTKASAYDVAFVRDIKRNSGTAQNILRRYLLKTF